MPSAYRINPALELTGSTESKLQALYQTDPAKARKVMTKYFEGQLQNPEELGIVPLIAAGAAAAPALIKGIGGLFKKKKKKGGAPAPAPAAAAAAGAKAGKASKDTEHHESAGGAHAALAGVPTDVKADALAALNHFQTKAHASKKKQADLVKKLAAVVKPQVDKMQAEVKTAALQRQVTSEHNRLVKEDQRWSDNDAAHKAILQKFDELQAALIGSNQRTQRVFKIYGVNV